MCLTILGLQVGDPPPYPPTEPLSKEEQHAVALWGERAPADWTKRCQAMDATAEIGEVVTVSHSHLTKLTPQKKKKIIKERKGREKEEKLRKKTKDE